MNEQDENQKNVQENNQDKDVSQKVAENVNDTVNAVKDTANLATNLAAQNYAGAVKDAANLLNNKVARRHLMLNYFINYIMPILAVILAIVVLASFVFAIWKGVGQAVQDVINGVVETADGFLTGIADFFNPDDGTIDVSDVQVDTIVNAITDLGVDLNGLKIMGDIDYNNPDYEEAIKEASRRYIREFYEAQAMTETLNTKPNWVEEYILNGGKPYGTVYVYRTNWENSTLSATSSDNQLKYVKYEEMLEMAENGDKNIKKYFSRDENAQLVVAGWTETKINDQETGQVTVNLYHINYKEYVSQYTTSMNFFLYLAEISENPEFVSAVTDLVKRSKINITLMDTETTTVQEVTTSSIKHVKTPDGEVTTEPVKNVSKTTTIVTVPTVKVTYAQTWFCEQTIEYNKKEDPPITNTRVETHSDTPQIDVGENINWSTNRTTSTVTTITKKYYEEGIRGDVIDRLGEKGSPGLNFLGKVDEETRFLGLLDDEFKIPNSTRYDIAGTNVVSGAEILFDLLQNDSYTQNLELVMRYALYKYTGKDYGVTEFDFSIFSIQDMKTLSYQYGGGSFTNITGVEGQICNFLLGKGVPIAGIAAIMGNIERESSFNPTETNGTHNGLCQWAIGGRFKMLEAYANLKGTTWADVQTQLEFMWSELESGYSNVKNIIMSASGESDLEYTTWYFARYYEIPWTGSYDEEGRKNSLPRYQYAIKWYQRLQSGYSSSISGGGTVYYQGDYNNVPYGSGTIGSCGCGPTAFAMVASDYTGRQITPADAVAWCGNTYYSQGVGTSWSYFNAATKHFNLPCTCVNLGNNINAAIQELQKGNLVISSQGPGLFTSGGHFILLSSIDASGGIRVRDPNKKNAVTKGYNSRVFTAKEISASGKNYWAFVK